MSCQEKETPDVSSPKNRKENHEVLKGHKGIATGRSGGGLDFTQSCRDAKKCATGVLNPEGENAADQEIGVPVRWPDRHSPEWPWLRENAGFAIPGSATASAFVLCAFAWNRCFLLRTRPVRRRRTPGPLSPPDLPVKAEGGRPSPFCSGVYLAARTLRCVSSFAASLSRFVAR